jgi:hypothetical protein
MNKYRTLRVTLVYEYLVVLDNYPADQRTPEAMAQHDFDYDWRGDFHDSTITKAELT